MLSTKDRILTESLKMFSERGYDSVSMRDIASAVGIKAASIYQHYKSKKEIFDSILERMVQTDYKRAKAYEVPEGTMDEMEEKYAWTLLQNIVLYSEAQFTYWTEDEFASCFRKMLTTHQFRSEEMTKIYQQYLGAGPTDYVAEMFTQMTGDAEKGRRLALDFYAPIFLLYSRYDAASGLAEKKKMKEMLHDHLERFAEQFEKEHGKRWEN